MNELNYIDSLYRGKLFYLMFIDLLCINGKIQFSYSNNATRLHFLCGIVIDYIDVKKEQ